MKPYHLLLLLFAASLTLASQCGDDEPAAELTLNFKAAYAEMPLVMFADSYDYPPDNQIKAQLFQFYLSDVTLLRDANATEGVLLSEIELVEFKDQITETAATEGVNLTFRDLPAGNYEAIRFGLGVAPDLNATQPGNYDSEHPLADHYWSAARGYVFAKFEGKADRTGTGEFSTGLTYHIGDDDLYRTLTYPVAITLTDFAEANATFTIDVQDFFTANGDYLDIESDDMTIDHTGNPVIYETLWDNLVQAIKVRQ